MIHVILYADGSEASCRLARLLEDKGILFTRVDESDTEAMEHVRAFPMLEIIGMQQEGEIPVIVKDTLVPESCIETLHCWPEDNELSGEPLTDGVWLRIARLYDEDAMRWAECQQTGCPMFESVALNSLAGNTFDRPQGFLHRTRRMTR